MILLVCLALENGLAHQLSVVVAAGEGNDLRTYEDVGGSDRFLKGDSLQRAASAQGHIGLSASKGSASGEVYLHTTESQSLALMDGDSPRQPQRELDKDAQLLFNDFLFFLIESIPHVLPDLTHHIVFMAVLVNNTDNAFFLVDTCHHANGTVYPAFLLVVLDEDNLGTRLDFQLHRSG